MCGIFGAIGKNIDANVLAVLAFRNVSRGDHATGAYAGGAIYKAGKASDIYWPRIERRVMRDAHLNGFLLGHTRHATCGDPYSQKNAHPHRVGHVVGTHNGIIYNDDELSERYGVTYPVDSQYLVHATAQGESELQEVAGWLGYAWADEHAKTVSLVRHSAPLAYGVSRGVLYYSSDATHLKGINGGPKDCDIKELAEDTVYTFRPPCIDPISVKKLTFKDYDRYEFFAEWDYNIGDYQFDNKNWQWSYDKAKGVSTYARSSKPSKVTRSQFDVLDCQFDHGVGHCRSCWEVDECEHCIDIGLDVDGYYESDIGAYEYDNDDEAKCVTGRKVNYMA